jgi:predicted amidohydrolase YtcJ
LSPETLVFNAAIRTMNPSQPWAEWILMRDGRIVDLGQGTPPDAALRIDAGGRLVLPGFQDAHIHLLNGGLDLVETAYLYDCVTLDDIAAVMARHAAAQAGPMIWGAGWQCGYFGDANLTRAVFDAVVSDRPCLIYDGNFHNACLNTAALTMVGITDTTADPPNGHILRDAEGHATGMLHEEAIAWAVERLPKTPEAVIAQGLRAGMAHANRHGITGVIDPSVLDYHAKFYGAADAEGSLTLRVAGACLVTAADTPDSAVSRLTGLRAAHRSGDFHLNAAKFFLDGGLENRTAAMLDPYADAAGGNAPLMYEADQIAALFTALDAARFQIHVHCIGDAATRAALDGFETARRANGPWPGLHQIAHVEVVHPDDRPRFAALGVMANLQPFWAYVDPVMPDATMAMIGPDRADWTYAFRKLIDAGALWCNNSDWAVTTLNPFEIIGVAVTREPPAERGKGAAFLPAEIMTVEEAVLGYTTHAAAACWRGHHTGQLRKGFSADLIVLDRDIFACDRHEIAQTQVLLTLFKGKPVHRHPAFGA